MDDYPEIEAE